MTVDAADPDCDDDERDQRGAACAGRFSMIPTEPFNVE